MENTILKTATLSAVSHEQLIADLADARVVYVGESHTNPSHHAIQLEVIKGLEPTTAHLSIGMEMFDHTYQPVLDQWTAGELDQTDFIGPICLDHTAREDELRSNTEPDKTGQALGCAIPRKDTKIDFRLAEYGCIGGNTKVTCQGQLAAAPESKSIDGCDNRLGQVLDPIENGLTPLGEGFARHAIQFLEADDIGPGDEAFAPGPGQDDASNGFVLLCQRKEGIKIFDDLCIEGIQLVRSVDGDRCNTVIIHLDQKRVVYHDV
jgi:hypothetical protein